MGSSHWHRLLDLISNPTASLSDTHGNQSYSLRPGTAACLPALQQPPGLAGEQACAKGTKTQKNKSCTWLEGNRIRYYSVTPANSGLQCQVGGPTCWSRNVPRVAIPWAWREQCYGTSALYKRNLRVYSACLQCQRPGAPSPAQEEKVHLPLGSGDGSL